MTSELIHNTSIERTPAQVMDMVNRVADATKALVGASIISLQGKKYIKVEGWQAIAAAHGCTVTADRIEAIEGGITAIATVRRLSDGAALGQAEGFVGKDEVWGKRPMYAQRAMAQTRAISRACRNAFAHVVVAMNSAHATGFETTPAEEVPEAGFQDRAPKAATVTGEIKQSIPKWSDEQKAVGGTLRARAIECGKEAEDAFSKLYARMKYDAPADTLDALADLVRVAEDVADQAKQEAKA